MSTTSGRVIEAISRAPETLQCGPITEQPICSKRSDTVDPIPIWLSTSSILVRCFYRGSPIEIVKMRSDT
ncbi:hypothetical protein [uncultured Marivita sp.]|uniref:hypothetical protein n=1 Tax=uncultured Marivita sp. TaxID=888080 RepID=UPI002616A6F7|nr:hypothetical protein [uncultured Marivita sp.]